MQKNIKKGKKRKGVTSAGHGATPMEVAVTRQRSP